MSVEALFKDWRKKISSMASNVFIAGMDKEDIEQELNIILWQCSEGYKGERAQFSTYFYTCARNKISKMRRYAMAKKRSCCLVPLEEGYEIPYIVEYDDVDLVTSIEMDKKLSQKQKNEMVEVALCGHTSNSTISVENANEFIDDLGYNISRRKKRK